MTVLADFPINSNVIVILVAVIFTAIKAFLERGKTGEPGEEEFDQEELARQYEEELRRQREEVEARGVREAVAPPPLQSSTPVNEPSPPPLQGFGGATPLQETARPIKPQLSATEKEALKNLKLDPPRVRKRRSSRQTGSTKSRIYRHLSSPSAAREALVLAEILGPPKAFKDEK